jgi:4-amino-4-deoxy-L-arabinose transferase-like glycosyltransferase
MTTLVTTLPGRIDDREEQIEQAFLLASGIFFLIHTLLRTAQQGALEIDEAELLFYSQQFQLGYSNQPPLYTWLQWAVFEVFGVNHAGLAALRNVLLYALYACMFRLSKPLLGALAAAAVSSSMLLIVPLGWEALIDRTHSTLATALGAGALWTYYTLLQRPGRWRMALLGALLGLGMLSKYNFIIFIIGLVAASLAVPEHRRQIWNSSLWIAVAAGTLCVLPHAAWFLQHLHTATSDTLDKMQIGSHGSTYASHVSNGFKNLFVSILSFISPLWLLLAFAYRSPRQAQRRFNTPDARFFLWMYAVGLAVVVAILLTGQMANFKSRWVQPLLFSVTLVCFVCFPAVRGSDVYRRVLLGSVVFGVVMTALLAVRPQVQGALGKHPRILQPYHELGLDLAQRFPDAKLVAVQDRDIGGNLHIHLPGKPIRLIEEACGPARRPDGKLVLLVQSGNAAPLRRFQDTCPGSVVVERGQVRAQSLRHPDESLRFDYVLVAPASGA